MTIGFVSFGFCIVRLAYVGAHQLKFFDYVISQVIVEMEENSGPLTNADGKLRIAKKYTIVLDRTIFPEGVYVSGTAKIAPATFEPSEDFLGSLRWEKKGEVYYISQEIKIPINVVVSGFDRPYVFENPDAILRSGIKSGKIFHECLIISKPVLSYKLLKEGAAKRVVGKDVDDTWGKEDFWGNMRRAAAGTRGGRRKQKRHRRTLRKSRRHHRTK